MVYIHSAFFICPSVNAKNAPASCYRNRGGHILYWCFLKPSRHYLRGFLIAACAAARRAMGTRKGEQLT